jgi:Glycosyl hydrolases family 25
MKRIVLFSSLMLLNSSPAIAQQSDEGKQTECQMIVAPAKFQENVKANALARDAGNEGIVPSGFVSIESLSSVVHGIDLSQYQDEADFTTVKKCGGSFAYVRLSAGTKKDNELFYRTHWANTRAAGLVPGPYHNLTVIPDQIARIKKEPKERLADNLKALQDTALESARTQAANFIERLDEVSALDPRDQGPEKRVRLPIALDLSVSPDFDGSAAEKKVYGPLYGSMICSFVEAIGQSHFSKEPLLLFIDPKTYVDYDLASAPCNLTNVMVWVRYRTSDGDTFARTLPQDIFGLLCFKYSSDLEKYTAGMKNGRCVMEQYTSFGGFAVFKPGAPLDLDRFLGSNEQFQQILIGE